MFPAERVEDMDVNQNCLQTQVTVAYRIHILLDRKKSQGQQREMKQEPPLHIAYNCVAD